MEAENKILITGCSDCPMCETNDMSVGYSCRIRQYPDNQIKESKRYSPITPKWCPAKNGVKIEYEK